VSCCCSWECSWFTLVMLIYNSVIVWLSWSTYIYFYSKLTTKVFIFWNLSLLICSSLSLSCYTKSNLYCNIFFNLLSSLILASNWFIFYRYDNRISFHLSSLFLFLLPFPSTAMILLFYFSIDCSRIISCIICSSSKLSTYWL